MLNSSPHREGITRRQALGGIAATGAALLGGAVLLTRKGEPEVEVEDVRQLSLERRLAMNAEEAERMWQMGAEQYMRDLRRRGQRLLTEEDSRSEKLECVDERQEDGITDCLAGLGVHIPQQRPRIAADMIHKVKEKYDALRRQGIDQQIKIDLTWHGDGMCGAALKALKEAHPNEPDRRFTQAEIDAKAQEGGELLGQEINRQLRERRWEHIAVVLVRQVPPSAVLHPEGHPGRVILVNGDPRLEFNRTGQGLLTYDTSSGVFDHLGIDDAILSAQIMMGNHGYRHVYGGHHGEQGHNHELADHEKPLYVAYGPAQIALHIKTRLENALRRLPREQQQLLHGRIDLVDSAQA